MATGDLYCRINNVERGPTGDATLQDWSLVPSGPFQRGSASLTLIKKGGGLSILPTHHVQCYVNIGGTYRALFGGFVKQVTKKSKQVSDGTHLVTYTVRCVDYNELLDELVQAATPAIDAGGTTTFQDHVTRICSYVSNAPSFSSPTFDLSGVGLSGTFSVANQTFFYAGMSLRKMLQGRCDAYQADIDTTARPRYWFSPPTSGVLSTGWTNSSILLNIVDGNINPTPAYHFHDGSGVGLTLIKIQDYSRELDGTRITTRVEAAGQVGQVHYFKTALSDNTTRTTYSNPYDARVILGTTQHAWNGPLLDGGTLNTTGEIQALADKHLAARQNPRETFRVVVKSPTIDPAEVMPGSKAARVTWATEGLSAYDYRIASTKITAMYDNTQSNMALVYDLQLGNKVLLLGDNDDDVTQAPVTTDLIAPDPVTGLTRDLNQYDAQRVLTAVREHFTASISPDVDHYHLWIVQLPQGGAIDRTITQMDFTGTVTPMVWLLPGVHTVLKVWAVDTSGNISTYTTDTFTTSVGVPNDKLVNGSFDDVLLEDTTQPASWTKTATNVATGAIDTTIKLEGANTLKLSVADDVAPSTITYTSDPVKIAIPSVTDIGTSFGIYASVEVYDVDALGTVTVAVQALTSSGSISGATNYLFNGTPSTGVKKYTATYNPVSDFSTAAYTVRMIITLTVAAGVTTSAWFGACRLEGRTIASPTALGNVMVPTGNIYGGTLLRWEPVVTTSSAGVPDILYAKTGTTWDVVSSGRID